MTKHFGVRILFFVSIIFLFVSIQCSEQKSPNIKYSISRVEDDSIQKLRIRMEFNANESGITKMEYANDAWGQHDLFDAIVDFQMISPEGAIEINRDSSWILLNHQQAGTPIILEYTVQQDFSLQENPDECYRPIIQDEYFHVFSHNLFMVPTTWEMQKEALYNIELVWEAFPDGYVIHNSFGSQEMTQSITEISLEKFHSGIFIGGDFRIYKEKIRENEVVLAVRGEWVPFEDNEVMEVLLKTLGAQRDFWDDHTQDYFTVTLRPISQENGSSFQGTGLTNSFATSMSNNEHTDIEQLIYLFNHELQHNWIGTTIQNSNEEEQYWFSEGFTEYYTLKNITKNKIGGLDEIYFVDQLNTLFRNLYSSPVVDAPNSEINYDNFWINPDYGKLPYYRGAIYAFLVDNWITQKTNGEKNLDQLMLEILHDSNEQGQKISHEYWLSKLKKYLGTDTEKYFNKHMEEGEPFAIATLLQDLGFEFDLQSKKFNMGFQFSDDKKSVEEVEVGSAAYIAGLRTGDEFITYSIEYGEITKPIALKIRRKKEEISINYMPVKDTNIPRILMNKQNLQLIRAL